MRQVRDLNKAIHKQQSFVHHTGRSGRDPFARLSPKSDQAIKRFDVERQLPTGDREIDVEDRKHINATVDRLAGAGVRSPSKHYAKPNARSTIEVLRWALENKQITIAQLKEMIK